VVTRATITDADRLDVAIRAYVIADVTSRKARASASAAAAAATRTAEAAEAISLAEVTLAQLAARE